MVKKSGSGKRIKGLEVRDIVKLEFIRNCMFNGGIEETFIQSIW